MPRAVPALTRRATSERIAHVLISVRLLNGGGIAMAGHVAMPVRVRLRCDGLQFRHRHDRKEADEQKEEDGKDAERPEEGEDVDDRRAEDAPARWKKVARERRADD